MEASSEEAGATGAPGQWQSGDPGEVWPCGAEEKKVMENAKGAPKPLNPQSPSPSNANPSNSGPLNPETLKL